MLNPPCEYAAGFVAWFKGLFELAEDTRRAPCENCNGEPPLWRVLDRGGRGLRHAVLGKPRQRRGVRVPVTARLAVG